jgi:MFS family permease
VVRLRHLRLPRGQISQVFFPTGDPTAWLLVTFGAFGLAYLVRPLGAIFVGSYTDKHGRKAGLTLSIALMMLGTTLIALTPGYTIRQQSTGRPENGFHGTPFSVSSTPGARKRLSNEISGSPMEDDTTMQLMLCAHQSAFPPWARCRATGRGKG